MTPARTTQDRREVAVRILEHEVGLLLRRIRRGITERAAQVHPDLNATSYLLLTTLSDFGPRRAVELVDLFSLDKGSVSRVVRQLVDLGLAERSPDPDDGRASIISVTDEATRRLALMHERRREHFAARLADWTPDDIEELGEQLGRFNLAVFDGPSPR
ncbi:MAG TPA: MarR family transcriptional regulator [Marmoricola sp.]